MYSLYLLKNAQTVSALSKKRKPRILGLELLQALISFA
jgi:hypothetical protein